jgi:UDP-glucose 4-epimerase
VKILVTGGAGFIGSHVVDAYLKGGHEVTVVDNLSTGQRKNISAGATFVESDLREAEPLHRLMVAKRFDAVNHQAAQMNVRKSVEDPAYDASVNINGMLNLLEGCVKTGVRKVVFASSGGAIYGEQETFPADERHPTRPISPYGVAKLATESYLHYYRAVHGIETVSLRYANVYGPRQNPGGEAGVISIFATRMLAGKEVAINGTGKQTRDYVYVGDVVRANVLALGFAGSDFFNVGTGIETDVNTLFGMLQALAGSALPERHAPALKGEQLRSVLDHGKIMRTLGWKPEVRLQDGLRQTVEFFRKEAGHGG